MSRMTANGSGNDFLCRVADPSVLRGVLGLSDSSSKTAEAEEV